MNKNIFKKVLILLSFVFLFNFTFAEELNNTSESNSNEQINVVQKKEKVIIRNGDSILYENFIDLPTEYNLTILDKDGVGHSIPSRSVLAILYSIDQTSDSFSIPYFEYNSSFDSLYLKCLVLQDQSNLCDNWQYVVNDSYPFVGMDKNILLGDEVIYIYFGPQNKILLSKNSINTNEELVVNTQKYDYKNNLWVNRQNVTIGLTKPNPNDPWSPIDDIKSLVDENGLAKFSNIPEGNYSVGVKEDFYWPTENLTVIKYVEPSSGGGGSVPNKKEFSINNAFLFLSSKQNIDGSYSSPMYTDWAFIALSQVDSSNKEKLKEYILSHDITDGFITDYERHAMALMSLGINPYDGTKVNYIQKIIDSFDGNQFGDPSLINDDIFAIIVLKNAGYTIDDEIIKKDLEYIISKQIDGSWGSIDMTAAGIEALSGFDSVNGVSNALLSARNYISSHEVSSGGFENPFSTSWVIQSGGGSVSSEDYITSLQDEDGGIKVDGSDIDSKIWATSYAIPAMLHRSWDEILKNFDKKLTQNITSFKQETIQEKSILLEPSPEIKKEEYILSTEKPLVKTEKIKSNINEDVISTQILSIDNIKKDIEKEIIPEVEKPQSKGFISSSWHFIKSIFLWLFAKLGF